jgi:hypothetical protein
METSIIMVGKPFLIPGSASIAVVFSRSVTD